MYDGVIEVDSVVNRSIYVIPSYYARNTMVSYT